MLLIHLFHSSEYLSRHPSNVEDAEYQKEGKSLEVTDREVFGSNMTLHVTHCRPINPNCSMLSAKKITERWEKCNHQASPVPVVPLPPKTDFRGEEAREGKGEK